MTADRLWQTAWVREDAAGRRWLEFADPTRCRRCRAGRGCGAAQWGRLFGRRPTQRLPLPDDVRLPPDTAVRAGLPANALLGLALRAYGVPLLALLLAIVATDRAGAPEPVSLAVGLAAALLALLWARRATLQGMEPVIEPWSEDCSALESDE